MKTGYRMVVFIAGFIAAGTLAAVLLPKEKPRNETAAIRIGAGDDVSGILMKETAALLEGEYNVTEDVESTAFKDCCSNTAQWALNAKEINVGFYCTHIARHTIEKNEDVMIYAPVIMNAELIAYKKAWEDVSVVGVTQGRERFKELAKETYPQIEGFREISQKGILYAVEDRQVDAAIMDISKATLLQKYRMQELCDHDYISYVLVVDKEFAKTEAFSDFIESCNEVIRRAGSPEELAKMLGTDEDWVKDRNIKFLTIDNQE